MCIGIPMAVEMVDGLTARAAARDGEQRIISLALTGCQDPGTWVLVHLDTAIRVLEQGEAMLIADAIDALGASLRGDSFEHLFADLIGRTPQLPPHLRSGTDNHTPREAAE